MKVTKLKINVLVLISSILFFACSDDDKNLNKTSENETVKKIPKYNEGLFIVANDYLTREAKINFVSFNNKQAEEVYKSTENYTVTIDADKDFYYLSNQRLDGSGNTTITVKDIESFEDKYTISEEVKQPIRVHSYNNEVFVINKNDEDFFNSKPFISVYAKDDDFKFKRRINLKDGTSISYVRAYEDKIYLFLPGASSAAGRSIVTVDLKTDIVTSYDLLATQGVNAMNIFNGELYISISPGRSIFTAFNREIYRLTNNNLELQYKVPDAFWPGNFGVVSSFKDELFIAADANIYETLTGQENLNKVFTNDKQVEFFHFLNKDTFWLISQSQLFEKNINDVTISEELFNIALNYSYSVFIVNLN